MNYVIQNIINEVKEVVKGKYPSLKGIHLFGSRVKSKHKKDSDLDIALIFNEKINWDIKDKVRGLIYDIMLKYDILIDFQIYSSDELEMTTPFRNSIISEGIYNGV